MVSTDPPAPFRIEIFRTGYYGGRGARLMTTLGPLQGTPQPIPPVGDKRLRECRWAPATTLTIPVDWPSGVYLGRLTTVPGAADQPYWQIVGAGVVHAARPHAALVALEPPARSRPGVQRMMHNLLRGWK